MPELHQFVDAYNTNTGRKQRVPAHFFDVPALCKDLSKTPKQKATDVVTVPEGDPTDSWTIAQLEAYATEHDIDLTDLGAKPLKADLLAVINAPAPTDLDTPSPDDTTSPDHHETPATGDEE